MNHSAAAFHHTTHTRKPTVYGNFLFKKKRKKPVHFVFTLDKYIETLQYTKDSTLQSQQLIL